MPCNRRTLVQKRPITSLIDRAYGFRRSWSLDFIRFIACTTQGTPTTAIFLYFFSITAVFRAARSGTHQLYLLPAWCTSSSLVVMTTEAGLWVQRSPPTVTTASISPAFRAWARIAVTAPPLCLPGTSVAAFAAITSM